MSKRSYTESQGVYWKHSSIMYENKGFEKSEGEGEEVEREISSLIAKEKDARREGDHREADILRGKANMLIAMYWGTVR